MKKVLLLILAALLVTCLFVSCNPDEEDEEQDTLKGDLRGIWVLYAGFTDIKLQLDGLGNFTYEVIEESKIAEQFSGTYYLQDSYIIFDANYQSKHTEDHPMHTFMHTDGDDVYLASNESDTFIYAIHQDDYKKFEKEGSTYSYSGDVETMTYTFNTSPLLNFKYTNTWNYEGAQLYKLETELNAKAEYTKNPEPDWYVKWYDESYSKYRITTQYTLTDDDKLVTYIAGNKCTFHRY